MSEYHSEYGAHHEARSPDESVLHPLPPRGPHWIGCHEAGPEHWHCALQEIERLRARVGRQAGVAR